MQGVGENNSWLLPGEIESWNIHPAFHLFCGLPEDWYLSPASEHWWDMIYSRSLDAWGLLNNTRELGSTLLLQSTCRTAERERLIQLQTSPSREGERSICPKTLTDNWKRKKKKSAKQEYYILQNCAFQMEDKQSWGNSSSLGLSYNFIFIYSSRVNLYPYTVKIKSHRKKIIFMTLFIKFE